MIIYQTTPDKDVLFNFKYRAWFVNPKVVVTTLPYPTLSSRFLEHTDSTMRSYEAEQPAWIIAWWQFDNSRLMKGFMKKILLQKGYSTNRVRLFDSFNQAYLTLSSRFLEHTDSTMRSSEAEQPACIIAWWQFNWPDIRADIAPVCGAPVRV